MLSRFIKVFPPEFKGVLGAPSSEQVYSPNDPVAVVADAEQLQPEQVQHG